MYFSLHTGTRRGGSGRGLTLTTGGVPAGRDRIVPFGRAREISIQRSLASAAASQKWLNNVAVLMWRLPIAGFVFGGFGRRGDKGSAFPAGKP